MLGKRAGFLEDKMSSGPKEYISGEGRAFQTFKLEQRIQIFMSSVMTEIPLMESSFYPTMTFT